MNRRAFLAGCALAPVAPVLALAASRGTLIEWPAESARAGEFIPYATIDARDAELMERIEFGIRKFEREVERRRLRTG